MSVDSKRLKDPIYGYIDIEKDIFEDIIDTANFQRLRNIIQTSYSPLYSSAVHNRFVHSLGVYYLGKMAANSFMKSFDSEHIQEYNLEKYIKVFQMACLLHDVGHAPFSHTGEGFYLEANSSRESLHNEIISLTDDETLKKELENKKINGAAPHELMSVIVGLRVFSNMFTSCEEKSFFARCITGYKYIEKKGECFSIYNCLISLLNSSIIDVDRLDYLIRDAYIIGFDTVSIDYVRLLSSVKAFKEDNCYELVFDKSAISVIENVVYAHDAERKWIQNHPVVQYEAYIIKHSMEVINKAFVGNKLFSYQYLTVDGKEIKDTWRISLLSDDDIVFLMKNNIADKLIFEYFSRKDRRHPLWKSESEYKAIFQRGFNDTLLKVIDEEFDNLARYLNSINLSYEINEIALKTCIEDIENTEKILETRPNNKEYIQEAILVKRKHQKWLECFKKYAESQNIDFDFVIIKTSQFNSGFGKIEFGEVKVAFPNLKNPCKFKDVTNILNSEKSSRDKFFYLFYRRKSKEQSINPIELAKQLDILAVNEIYDSK